MAGVTVTEETGSGKHNPNWPPGWLPNLGAAETESEYAGDPSSTWVAGEHADINGVVAAEANGSATGFQPRGQNTKGTIGSVPVMAMTAAVAATLSGDPRQRS